MQRFRAIAHLAAPKQFDVQCYLCPFGDLSPWAHICEIHRSLQTTRLKSSRLAESLFNRVALSMRVTLYCPSVAPINGGISR